jgi:hypothetical protein
MSELDPARGESNETQPAEQETQFGEGGEETEPVFVAESSKGGRTTALLMLGFVIIGVGVIYFMRLKGGPATAAASAESATAKTTINQFLNDKGQNLRAMEEMLRNTEKFVQQWMKPPKVSDPRLEELKSNPFRFYKPKAADTSAADLAKMDAKDKDRVARAAGQLKLQFVISSGTSRSCMIGNKMYTEGQEIDGFTVDKITPTAVIVKQGKWRFELKINK